MKITDIIIFTMDAYRSNWAFIKVETDAGIYGWGEASLGGNEKALEGMVADLKRLVIGRNPFEIEKMMFEVYRDIYWKGGAVLMSALSGIEIAMWDIVGKALEVPIYTFFGGKIRDKVKMYANAWFVGAKEPEEFAKMAKRTVGLGIKALKWDPFGSAYMEISNEELERASRIVDAVRQAVGSQVDLLIECHGRFYPAAALKISRELEQYHPMLMEEPCIPDAVASMAKVAERSNIPIAGGERCYSLFDLEMLLSQKISYLQPDVFHCGGLLVGKKAAAMAQAKHVSVSFHNPSGPVSNAAILQLAATVPNFYIHEIMLTDGKFRKEICDEQVMFEDGYIQIPNKPGLGIDVHVAEIEKRPYRPIDLRHYTGAVTNIRAAGDTVYYFNGLEDVHFE